MKLQITCEEAIEPKCRHFRQCGGCQFQHVPYDEQLAQKKAFVSRCFEREVDSILPCEPFWRYRNKMEFSFSQARSGEKFLGLMKRRGRVENLEECYLTHPWFLEVLQKVRAWWEQSPLTAYHPPTNRGLLRNLTLRMGTHSKEQMVVLTVSEEPFLKEYLTTFAECVGKVDALLLRRQIIQKKVPTRFEEEILKGRDYIYETLHSAEGKPYQFRIKAASFFQPNSLQAETIYQKAIEAASLTGKEQIFDLYCGTGSLGIFAAHLSEKVLGIEIVAEAVEDARKNLDLNQITNMELMQGDVSQLLDKIPFEPDLVFVDPPRVGLGEKTISHLKRLNPKKIVYVSCNPLSQAADCALLGFSIESLQPIDQFPHTPHVENIALLSR